MVSPRRRAARRGIAALETVLTIGAFYSMAMLLLILGCRACNLLYHAIGTLVGWPLL
jgi:hypothetical protein